MQQSPRFAPFGPWKPSSTSSILFPPFRGLGLNLFQPSSSVAPLPPPKEENIWGNNATGFSLFMKRNIAPEMPRHPKYYRYYYGARVVPLPQIGLGRFLHTLQGKNNATGWQAELQAPINGSDGLPSPSILSPLGLDPDDAPHLPQSTDSQPAITTERPTSSSWDRISQTSDHRLSEATQEDILPSTSDNAIPPSPLFLLEADDASRLPQSVDDELKITIGGPTGYLSWDHVAQTSDIFTFFQKRNMPASNSLSVHWHNCAVDQTGARGRTTLKLLFRYLNKPFPYQDVDSGSLLCPLATMTKMSIKVPKVVRDLNSIDLLGQIIQEDDSIDLRNASNVQEFSWSGDFGVFALKFSNIPLASLTVLSLTECLISVDDAVAVAHSCPELKELILETIVPSTKTDLGNLVKPSMTGLVDFPNLTSLKVKCTEQHGQLINHMVLRALKNLVLHLDKDRVHVLADFNNPTIPWLTLEEITIVGKVTNAAYDSLQDRCSVRCSVEN